MQEKNNILLIDSFEEKEIIIAKVTENNELLEYKTVTVDKSLVGSVYLAKIEKIEHGIEAVFLNLGFGLKAFISFKDIANEYWEFDKKSRKLKTGLKLIVQITKDQKAGKNCVASSFISLSGLNCIFFPNSPNESGISRNIKGQEKIMFKEFLSTLNPNSSLIIRTASKYSTVEEVKEDYLKICALWNLIKNTAKKKDKPGCLHKEDEILNVVRGYSKHSLEKVEIGNKKLFKQIQDYQEKKLIAFPDSINFSKYNLFQKIQNQIDSLYQKEVFLNNGGSIIIEQTQAMITIDVNSKNYLKEKNMNETSFKVNYEAALEVCKQIALRNLSGLIIIDFIDMTDLEHKKIINEIFKEFIKNDKAACKMIALNEFNILQLSRERTDKNLFEKHCVATEEHYRKSFYFQALDLLIQMKNANLNTSFEVSKPVMQELINSFKNDFFSLNLKNVNLIIKD